jgi:hypothetical protein
MSRTLKVMSLYLKTLSNRSKLLFEDIVPYFGIGEALRMVGNRVLVLLC